MAALTRSEAHAALVEPYLRMDLQADGWHLIDNADADDVREALKAVIELLRPVNEVTGRPMPLDIGNHHNAAVCPYCRMP